MKTIGFMYSCFKEKKAIEYSVKKLKEVYPEYPVCVFSDGGLDYSYLEKEYSNLYTFLEEDTMSVALHATGDPITGNWREEKYKTAIKKCAFATLDRIERTINQCKTDWIVMMDPDTLVRGKLTIPDDAKLLGSLINCCFPQKFQNIFKKVEGAKVIKRWGASPCVFESDTFLKALNFFRENVYLFDEFLEEYYAMHAHDILIPVLFALIGEEEKFNPDIIECGRDPDWRNKKNPLVHQFEDYYE